MANQSAFSFHCMICFEEFHPDERYPVVLPCGHTYVCNICGDRLDKCMECRMPLYMTLPRNGALNNQGNTNTAASRSTPSYRTPRGVAPPSPPLPPVKKRLPLPKNVVLLSLIEATELATEDASSKLNASPKPLKTTNSNSIGSLDGASGKSQDDIDKSTCASVTINAEDLEEERIRLGTSMAVSVAGTYAVRDEAGLPIYQHRPSSRRRHSNDNGSTSMGSRESSCGGKQNSEEDVDKLVRHFHQDQRLDNAAAAAAAGASSTDSSVGDETDDLKENRMHEHAPARLSWGDRVQVVAIEGKWAKLARGYGYVRADDNKLVKVGSTVDRACKLEAMLRSLSTKRKQLRLEQSKVDNMFIRLMNDLQVSLVTDEDLTVILADTFVNAAKKNAPAEKQREEKAALDRSAMQRVSSIVDEDDDDDDDENVSPLKPRPSAFRTQQEQRQDPPGMEPAAVAEAGGYGCFANDMFDSIAGCSDETEFQRLRREQGLATPVPRVRTTASIGSVPATLFPSASHPSPSAMSAGARAWREKQSGVDFKTGMSGHMALLSSHAHPHEYLGGVRLPSFHGMSNHTGLSITKPIKKSVGALYQSMYQSFYPTLNAPSLSGSMGGTPERPQQTDSRSDDRSVG